MSKVIQWFKTPVQQPQADAGDSLEKVMIGEAEIEVRKDVAELLRGDGRTQATQAFIKKALKVKPEEMDIDDKIKPGKVLEQFAGIMQEQANMIAEYKTKASDKPEENEDLKKAKEQIAKQANELSEKEATMYKNFARDQAIANVLSSSKRDFNLTEEAEELFDSMIKSVFDFEVDSDGNGSFAVTFNRKGESIPFMPEGKIPTSKQLAELIAKRHPGNHGNGVPAGGGTRRTAQPGGGVVGKPNEEHLRIVEDRAWGS